MTFPKKYNRRIVVGGETYVWYLKRSSWDGSKHIAVRHGDGQRSGHLLLIDFYAFEFEIRPDTIRQAIEFALANGWTPLVKSNPLYIGFDNVKFVVLPRGEQFLRIYQHPPSMPHLRVWHPPGITILPPMHED